MKQFVFFVFLLGLNFNSLAQEYIPLLEDGNIWVVEYDGFYNVEGQYTICQYTLGNEVTINNLTYKELLISSTTPNAKNPHNGEDISSIPSLFLYVREDINEKKAYKLSLDYQTETIFRNFSYENDDVLPNDIIVGYRHYGTFFNTNTRSMRLSQTYGNDPFTSARYLYLYEGIGSKNGLLENCWSDNIDGFSYLTAFTHNGATSYNNQFVLSTNDYFIKNDIKLFYSQQEKKLKLNNTSSLINISIYSTLGKRIILKKTNHSMDVSHLKKGIYFYQLSNGNSLKKGKILIF